MELPLLPVLTSLACLFLIPRRFPPLIPPFVATNAHISAFICSTFFRDWSFITSQIGMFTYTGCTVPQVENMTNKWHVYMTADGRISLAGLSGDKCDYLADAIIDSVKIIDSKL